MTIHTIKATLAALLSAALIGCSSRAYFQNNALTPVTNAYNRNFIVAAPTALGNIACGTPFFLLSMGLAQTRLNSNIVNGIYLVPATMCGAVTGLPFMLFSYVCPENPWDYGFKSYRNVNWMCERDQRGFTARWDIRSKGSLIEQDLVVSGNRTYRIEILFGSIPGVLTEEELRVPVRLRVERTAENGTVYTFYDEVIETQSSVFSGPIGVARKIATIELQPGHYRLAAITLRESMLPTNVETHLRAVKITP